ncbi:MAG: BatD family protein [Bacteroidia bacterium]
MNWNKHRGLLLALLLLCISGALHAQSFSVEVNRRNVVAGERFAISFVVKGSRANPNFPNLAPLMVEGGRPSVVSNFAMVNGHVSQNVSYTFYVRAPKEGTYTIGSASIKAGSRIIKTSPIKIKASKAAPSSGDEGGTGKEVFILPILSKDEVYVGQRLTVTYKLYTRKSIRDLDLAENPVFDGFSVEVTRRLAQSPKDEQYNGLKYRTFQIRQFHLFPQREGEANIPQLTFRGRIGGLSDPSDPFNWQRSVRHETRLIASEKASVQVKPWPQDAPDDFSGLVGTFGLQASLDRRQLKTGETARLRVLVSGEGNIRLQGIPKLKLPESFDVFDPDPREGIQVNAEAVNAQKVFDFLLAPREPGLFQLPEVTISFLNPETGTYDRMRAPLSPLTVTGESLSKDIQIEISPELENDIRIKSFWGSARAGSKSIIGVLLAGIPFILLAIFGFWLKKKAVTEALPETALRRSMAAAKRQLADAQQLLEKGDNKAFYSELNRTLWAYLEDRLELPGSSQTRAELQSRLQARSVTPEQETAVLRLLDESEMAVYAPGAVAPPPDAYAQALTLLDQLESQFNPES